jgi:RHS repeat-associated protein
MVLPHTFTSQRERDDESSLMHYRARSYDPRTGRFIQQDPIIQNRPFEHYRYPRNPVSLVDPTGREPEWLKPPKEGFVHRFIFKGHDTWEYGGQLHESKAVEYAQKGTKDWYKAGSKKSAHELAKRVTGRQPILDEGHELKFAAPGEKGPPHYHDKLHKGGHFYNRAPGGIIEQRVTNRTVVRYTVTSTRMSAGKLGSRLLVAWGFFTVYQELKAESHNAPFAELVAGAVVGLVFSPLEGSLSGADELPRVPTEKRFEGGTEDVELPDDYEPDIQP